MGPSFRDQWASYRQTPIDLANVGGNFKPSTAPIESNNKPCLQTISIELDQTILQQILTTSHLSARENRETFQERFREIQSSSST